MNSNGHYILSLNPKRGWARATGSTFLVTPLLQEKKKYEVLKQNNHVPPLSIKKPVSLTSSVRVGNTVYPIQSELYATVLSLLNEPVTIASLKKAISTAQAQLGVAPRYDVQMKKLPRVLNLNPRRTYLAGGSNWLKQVVPPTYPINFKLEKTEFLLNFPIIQDLMQTFVSSFENQTFVGIYRINYVADDGVTFLHSEYELFRQLSGRQIISIADWNNFVTTNNAIYTNSLIIIRPSSLDIYGGVYPIKIGFIFSFNNSMFVAVLQGLLEPYKFPYPDSLDVAFQFLATDWAERKKQINQFLRSTNFNNNVNYKLLRGPNAFPQLA
jgi:hypothetical protein